MDDSISQLCLRWNHFKENFTSHFEYLKEEEAFVDVTLSCQGKLLRAHKVLLSASSPYLTLLFKENPCKHPVIILDDMPFSHLESLMAFIYTGAVSITETELPAFLESASLLQIRGLSEKTPLTNQPSPSPLESNPRKRTLPILDPTDFLAGPKRVSSKTESAKKTFKPLVPDVEVKQEETVELGSDPEYQVKKDEFAEETETEVGLKDAYHGPELEESHSQSPPNPKTRLDTEPNTTPETPEYSPVERRKHSLDPRPCPICNRLYSNLSNLRQHLRLIHNPTVVVCKLCFKTFKTDLYLRRHLMSFHELNLSSDGEKSFAASEASGAANGKPVPAFKELVPANQMRSVVPQ